MKILHLMASGNLPQRPFAEPMSGMVASVLEISRRQAASGYAVKVAVAGLENWKITWENVSLLSLRWAPWARIQIRQRSLDFRRHVPIMLHCLYNDYDIIHGRLFLYLRGLKGKRKIVHFNADPTFRETNVLKGSGIISKDFDRILADTDAQIAASEFVADQLRIGFAGKGNIHVVHNGVDHRRFINLDEDLIQSIRKALPLPPSAKVILYSGAVALEKGVIYLVEAYRNLIRRLENVYLLVVGDSNLWGDRILGDPQSDYVASVKQVISGDINAGKALFTGKQAYHLMPYFYQMSDIVVVPSICNEAFPNVVLEAMTAGQPVIATRTGGMVDVLNDGNSLKVAPGSVEELEAAMYRLLTDKTLYARLAAQARQDAAKFTWEAAVDKIMAIYRQVLCS